MLKSQCVIDGDGIACEQLDHIIGFPNPPRVVRAPLTGEEVMSKINEGYGLSMVSLGKGPFPAQPNIKPAGHIDPTPSHTRPTLARRQDAVRSPP
eukprot:CAMPEP_0172181428 /NCGR_PEP_ID=MMETSP1050-20130122/17809_1 /TAXON_ID=233186 /ORGANISM="Cryptomonas curvata, Strain CCAP979/52" /LENGTH=94 /DNA_ID=CAMNT_0012854703 /DNA_START=75 /DNA_END=357 /DNA_ORIENTATION=-